MPEFKRSVLEVLRQPVEERKVTISRSRWSVDYPASFTLVASMNPCPCGYYNHPTKVCHCQPGSISRYLNKISGPLLDRIDIHLEVMPVSHDELTFRSKVGEKSAFIRARVIKARNIQEERYAKTPGIYHNAMLPGNRIQDFCPLPQAGQMLLKSAMQKLNLSVRAYDKIIKLSRTIADLAGSVDIGVEHIAEAIHFRSLDREGMGNV